MASYSPGQASFTVDTLLFDPLSLPRPSERRLILGFLLALATLIHLGTVGWGQLYDGSEGWNAASVRQLPAAGNLENGAPPLLWLFLNGSYRFFGFYDWAARIPIAMAVIATVWLVFLIAERLGGTWRGFAAGSAALFSPGFFVIGRTVSGVPLGTALICGAIYCGIRGFRLRRRRRWWYLGVWLCAGLAALSVGAVGWMVPVGTFALTSLLYKDSRVRSRSLFSFEGIFLFLLIQSPWLYAEGIAPAFSALPHETPVSYPWLRGFLWMFPWSVIVLGGVVFYASRLIAHRRIEFRDGVPWILLGLAALLYPLASGANDLGSPLIWAPAALVLAATWSNLPRWGQIAVTGVILAITVAITFPSEWIILPTIDELRAVPADVWPWFRWMVMQFSTGMVLFSLAAFIFTITRHQRLPIMALSAAVLPLGFTLLELRSKLAPYFSSAEVAEFLNGQAALDAAVFYPGARKEVSTLQVYSDRILTFAEPSNKPENAAGPVIYVVCRPEDQGKWRHFHMVFRGNRFWVLGNEAALQRKN